MNAQNLSISASGKIITYDFDVLGAILIFSAYHMAHENNKKKTRNDV